MIYATGDLHGNSLRFQPQYFPEQASMTKDDYMIVCGDFGCVWNGDRSDDPAGKFRKFVRTLST